MGDNSAPDAKISISHRGITLALSAGDCPRMYCEYWKSRRAADSDQIDFGLERSVNEACGVGGGTNRLGIPLRLRCLAEVPCSRRSPSYAFDHFVEEPVRLDRDGIDCHIWSARRDENVRRAMGNTDWFRFDDRAQPPFPDRFYRPLRRVISSSVAHDRADALRYMLRTSEMWEAIDKSIEPYLLLSFNRDRLAAAMFLLLYLGVNDSEPFLRVEHLEDIFFYRLGLQPSEYRPDRDWSTDWSTAEGRLNYDIIARVSILHSIRSLLADKGQRLKNIEEWISAVPFLRRAIPWGNRLPL